MSSRHFELLKKPELIIPTSALRRRSIIFSGALPSITYTGASASIVNTSGAHTYSSQAFGTANGTRNIIVVIYREGGTAASLTVTIGGIAATQVARTTISGGRRNSEMWIAPVPTGTTGTIVLAGPGGNWTSAIGVYSALYLLSSTPTATSTDNNNTVDTSVAVGANGIIVATAGVTGSPTTVAVSGVTQDFATSFASGVGLLSGGSGAFATAATVAIKFNFSGGASAALGVSASFR